MSFSSDAKAELCRLRVDRSCCAVAEAYGILMYCNMFSPDLIRISTVSPDFSARLPKLFSKAFGLTFDTLPGSHAEVGKGGSGRRTFTITSREKISVVYETFGLDPLSLSSAHVNFALLEEECCRSSFLRGAFLAGGSVTDPARGNHLELSTSHRAVARETCSILRELELQSGESSRQGNTLLYFKQPDMIADFLTTIGASTTALGIMTARVDREMRNRVTRQINCDSANADRTVSAAQEQIDAIRTLSARCGGLEALPDGLRDAALLRVTNPEASLADLARLSYPPVSKGCLAHRLRRIISLAAEPRQEAAAPDAFPAV